MALYPNGTLSRDMLNALSNVYIAFLTPSVIGSFSVLVVSIVKWRNLRNQVHLLVQLALADLLAALILMSTSVMNKVSTSKGILICLYSLPLSLTFYFISFLLVVVYAWKSRSAIQGWRENQSDDQRQQARTILDLPLYAMVWLVPLALYLAYVLTDCMDAAVVLPTDERMVAGDNAYCTSCILFLHVSGGSCSETEKFHSIVIRLFLFFMVIPVMLTCSIIYYKVGKWYERHEQAVLFPVEGDGRSRRSHKRTISTARNMVIVILICWTPVLVLILLSILMIWKDIEQQHLFWVYVIQAISVSLHGFLNSMVYAWRRQNFTEAVLGEHTPLIAYNRRAFFEESF
ncbi:unnamed protein product [Ophioblennius macclurei]